MADFIVIVCFTVLGLILCQAAISDARFRHIPNWLTLSVALLAIPYWLASSMTFWPDIALQAGFALAVLCAFAGLFWLGMMGGGDVKLLAALALWLPLDRFVELVVVMSLAGGLLTVAMLFRHHRRKRIGDPEIPYGLAITFAAGWTFSTPAFAALGSL